MFDLSYFNLGFRSDSVSNLLSQLQHKSVKNDYLLNDANSIIIDCLKIKDDNVLISNLSPNKGYEMNALLPLLAEYYASFDVDYVVSDLKKVAKIIEKVKRDRRKVTKEEYDHAISFFSKLADLCLSNSAHQGVVSEQSS